MAQFYTDNRTILLAFLMLVVLAVVFVFLMLYVTTISYLIFPFLIFLILHYRKIWKTKQRLIMGSLALIIGAILMMAILTPIITSEYMNVPSTFSTNSSTNVINLTVNPHFSTSAQNYTVTYISKLNSTATFNVSKLSGLGQSLVYLFNITAVGILSNNNYNFTIVLNNLTAYMNKDMIEINVTQNKTYTVLLGPILLSNNTFKNMVNEYANSIGVSYSLYWFIFAEILYLLLVFGAIMLRRGRLGIGRSKTPPT